MLDIKLLREKLDEVIANLARRGFHFDREKFLRLEEQRRVVQTRTQELQNTRNTLAKAIGQAKAQGGDSAELKQQAESVNTQLQTNEENLQRILDELETWLAEIPNLLQADVPHGTTEQANEEVRRWGEIPTFAFTPKDHVALGEEGGGLDFAAAAKITGARFVVLQGNFAKLHRALIQFMLDVHTQEHGYQEVYVPYIVNRTSLFGTGQLPKFAEDLFALEGEQNYYLIPTAEVPVTNLLRDTLLPATALPIKYVCHTPCFRSEAGAYGKDTRGMIRQHQFEKVELVQFTPPEQSQAAHEELTHHAETILQKLRLPYRVMKLCSGDTGFTSSKTYDLEVWLPGQQCYREISSCSNFQSFQARRLQARFKNPVTGKNEYLHTLNGSGLAVGRTLIAIMENYQDAHGKIHVPEVLQPYLRGQATLS